MDWKKKVVDAEVIKEISRRYQCDTLTSSILARRGVTSGKEILFFLEKDSRYLHNPFCFSEMEDAIDRVIQAKEEGEKVLVFGDRDVDGITSTTLLVEELSSFGLDITWKVPEGEEPYGLSKEAIDTFAKNYGSLIITVDCGITNIEEIDYAAELGIDVIVLDHHQEGEELPGAVATIDPKVKKEKYPFNGLSGCGVAYKFICALHFSSLEIYKQQLCLLNVRPINEAYTIDAIKISNMVKIDTLSETIVPGLVRLEQTRLFSFLQGQQIFVWNGEIQKKMLSTIFGKGVEFNFMDIAPEIAKLIPQTAGLSLLRIKEMSKIARYAEEPPEEIEGFYNIFVSFVRASQKMFTQRDRENLQLVAISTIADMMPLRNENRILVKLGLESINLKPRNGLCELLSHQKLLGRKVSTTDIAWQVSPILNAAGRMEQAGLAVQMLLEKEVDKREALLVKILELNEERKQKGNDSWTIIEPLARTSLKSFEEKLVLAISSDIPRGVTGIMASKAVNMFKAPAIVLALMSDGIASGSMRSTKNFDITPLRESCGDLFIDHGGHSFAAGFSISQEKIPELSARLENVVSEMDFTLEKEQTLHIDAELPHQYLTPDIILTVDAFEPYGELWDQILFASKKVHINSIDFMGKSEKQHVKLTLDFGKYKFPGIIWSGSDRVNVDFAVNDYVDIVYQISRNIFNGTENIQLILSDIRRSI